MLEQNRILGVHQRQRSGTISCIPLHLHFSTHGLFRLRKWGSTGSWVRIQCRIKQ